MWLWAHWQWLVNKPADQEYSSYLTCRGGTDCRLAQLMMNCSMLVCLLWTVFWCHSVDTHTTLCQDHRRMHSPANSLLIEGPCLLLVLSQAEAKWTHVRGCSLCCQIDRWLAFRRKSRKIHLHDRLETICSTVKWSWWVDKHSVDLKESSWNLPHWSQTHKSPGKMKTSRLRW